MEVDQIIDEFVQRMNATNSHFDSIDAAPWIDDFETMLPKRLPQSYLSLFSRYRFPGFQCREVQLFGNNNGRSEDELVIAARKDPYIWSPTVAHAFVPIGRPVTGAYDPICFDMRQRRHNREWPIVCLDHEELLQRKRAQIKDMVAANFLALIGAKE